MNRELTAHEKAICGRALIDNFPDLDLTSSEITQLRDSFFEKLNANKINSALYDLIVDAYCVGLASTSERTSKTYTIDSVLEYINTCKKLQEDTRIRFGVDFDGSLSIETESEDDEGFITGEGFDLAENKDEYVSEHIISQDRLMEKIYGHLKAARSARIAENEDTERSEPQ